MTELICPENSPCVVRMLDALYDHGPMNVKEWAVKALVSEETIRAYATQLTRTKRIHIVRIEMNHMKHRVVRIYGYGEGVGTPPPRIRITVPIVPHAPRPDPITSALMRI